jgi:hypothetical protein
MVYTENEKTNVRIMVSVWKGQLVPDSSWTEPVFRFRYYFDDEKKRKND